MDKTLFLTLVEAAEIFRISQKTARNWCSLGKFPVDTFLIGARRLVRVSDVEAFVSGLGGGNSTQVVTGAAVSAVAAQKLPRGRPRKTPGATATAEIRKSESASSKYLGMAHRASAQNQLNGGGSHA